MVKRMIILLVVMVSFNSCCDIYYTSMSGRRSKRKYKKYVKYKVNPNQVGISTDIIYKSIDILKHEGRGGISSITDPIALRYNSFLLFRTNGNCYSFREDTKKEPMPIQENRFNVLKGDINYIVSKKDNYFFREYNIVNCGVFSKWEFDVKGDTLGIAYGHNIGSRIWYYYIKTDIPVD